MFMPSSGKHPRRMVTSSEPFTMNQAELPSHSTMITATAYYVRDWVKGLCKLTVDWFRLVVNPTPLELITQHPIICMRTVLIVENFTISFRGFPFRQVATYVYT